MWSIDPQGKFEANPHPSVVPKAGACCLGKTPSHGHEPLRCLTSAVSEMFRCLWLQRGRLPYLCEAEEVRATMQEASVEDIRQNIVLYTVIWYHIV